MLIDISIIKVIINLIYDIIIPIST